MCKVLPEHLILLFPGHKEIHNRSLFLQTFCDNSQRTQSSVEKQNQTVFIADRNPVHGGAKPVFIECGSANSFELSPRFANLSIR